MTLNKLIEKLNTMISENSEIGELQVYSLQEAECKSFNNVNLMLVNKKSPTKNYPFDYDTLLCHYDNFKKEDYTKAIVLGWE